MKKIFSFLAVAVIAFFAVSCGGNKGANTGVKGGPASIEKTIYAQLQKGNYAKAVEIMVENLDNIKASSAEETAQMLSAFTEKAKESNEAKGGVKSFEVLEEEISEDGLSAVVSTKIVYGNGEEKTETSKYVKKDGKWKLSMGK